ncbi:MAG: hypothetical protein QOH58_2996 [Thermoleophilaceae bacterium]|jgi:hypothetical protein|nr:hypothetical protein [Thermoleophilaceae bacterium]
MKKELRPVQDVVTCDVCGRTILKGERAEPYLAPGGHRHQVCALCSLRAQNEGWIRESAAGDMPARMPRSEPRRGVLGRLRRRRPPEPPPAPPPTQSFNGGEPFEQDDASGAAAAPRERSDRLPPRAGPRSRPKDPRHVRAVPTTAQAKVDRALDLFNGSTHQRTIAGLARTLGTPFVSAQPDTAQGSQVSVVVAWELSWYRYRVDLGDEADPVMLLEKGEEIEQIESGLRDWNARLDADGRVLAGHTETDGGSE